MKTAQKLIVTAFETTLNGYEEEYTFEAYEFENGMIIVPNVDGDEFYVNRDNIEASGNALVKEVKETGELTEFSDSIYEEFNKLSFS